jgi:hypothetical protein
MKKIILLFSLFVTAFVSDAQSQCVPNAKTAPGNGYIIPDSATGMIHGCAGIAYDETFYIKVPKDTSVFTIAVGKFDSVIINVDAATIGLPSYINNITTNPATQPANSKHPFKHIKINRKAGDSLACIRLQGLIPANTIPSSTALNIPFAAYLKLTVGGIPFPFGTTGDTSLATSYSSYKFVVDAPGTGVCALGINNTNANINDVKIWNNSNFMQMSMAVMQQESVTIALQNTVGQIVSSKNVTLNTGANFVTFDVASLANGIYIYSIRNKNGQTSSGKFVK